MCCSICPFWVSNGFRNFPLVVVMMLRANTTNAVWALVYNLVSLAVSYGLKKVFKFPSWTVVATCFNNTTSLPLLLIKSLGSTGILEDLLGAEGDVGAAIGRAQSFFLVNSVVSNVLTFSLGPKLLDGRKEDPEDGNETGSNGSSIERDQNDDSTNDADEETSLLPKPVNTAKNRASRQVYRKSKQGFEHLPRWLQKALEFGSSFLNPPMFGILIGALLGLAPPLHRAFFNEPQDGGIFKAWLTTSVENIGGLFAALQIVVVGVKLCDCLRRMKSGQNSGKLPLGGSSSVLLIRFIIWPL
jgi:auxin efflux carrier family protein